MVEKVLLVLERLRAANVFEQKVRKGGSDHVALLGRQLDLGLAAVVDDEDRAVTVAVVVVVADRNVGARRRRQELELKKDKIKYAITIAR